jgi:hypothetical protein
MGRGEARGSYPHACIGEGAALSSRAMAKRKRTYMLKWRSKRANHGVKPNRGRNRGRIRRSMNVK